MTKKKKFTEVKPVFKFHQINKFTDSRSYDSPNSIHIRHPRLGTL